MFCNEFSVKRKILVILGVLPFSLMRLGVGIKTAVTCVKKPNYEITVRKAGLLF